MQAYQANMPGTDLVPVTLDGPIATATDVEVDVRACALCHSDLHLWRGDWGAPFPLVPGHEIVGRITRVGSGVRGFALGDRVGVGWQCGACFACDCCQRGDTHLCTGGKVRTCVGRVGGLAERIVADYRFAYRLPEGISDTDAAPLMCAGLTVFSPMVRFAVGAGRVVGIVGLGGLGHLAVQFAAKLGAIADAFDPDMSKAADARACGARQLIDSSSTSALAGLRARYDLILVTTPASLNWNDWIAMLRVGGTLCLLGVPSAHMRIDPELLLDGQRSVTGDVIGNPNTMRAMLAFADLNGVRPMIERARFADVNDAMKRLAAGSVRYRVVLESPA